MFKANDTALSTGAGYELRLPIPRVVEAIYALSQLQLIKKLGLSVGGVNCTLKALIERGCVKACNLRKSGASEAYLCVFGFKGVSAKTSARR